MKLKRNPLLVIILICLFSSTLNAQKRGKDSLAKDTLYFKFDQSHFKPGKYNKDQYYVVAALKDSGSSEVVFLKEVEVKYDLEPQTIQNFEEYIRGSVYYYPDREKNKIDDFGLATHLGNYVVFLVDSSCEPVEFLQVHPWTEIE